MRSSSADRRSSNPHELEHDVQGTSGCADHMHSCQTFLAVQSLKVAADHLGLIVNEHAACFLPDCLTAYELVISGRVHEPFSGFSGPLRLPWRGPYNAEHGAWMHACMHPDVHMQLCITRRAAQLNKCLILKSAVRTCSASQACMVKGARQVSHGTLREARPRHKHTSGGPNALESLLYHQAAIPTGSDACSSYILEPARRNPSAACLTTKE